MIDRTQSNTFNQLLQLCNDAGCEVNGFTLAVEQTLKAEQALREALSVLSSNHRLLEADVSLVVCGSFARGEFVSGSDYDWTLLVDGAVNRAHADLALKISHGLNDAGLTEPGSSGTFGNMVVSHDLVHRIGGMGDSNPNLTRRMSMLLESRPVSLSAADSSASVWNAVLRNILGRYFEEDVHFSPQGSRRVPRFLVNDLTRYWRTIGVDFAAKHQEQAGKKWGIRNAKLRFSRKLLYAAGLAFCLSCDLQPPDTVEQTLFGDEVDQTAQPYVGRAMSFASTPALEYLATFIHTFVRDDARRNKITRRLFGTYNWWLETLADKDARGELESLSFSDASKSQLFSEIRTRGTEFAKGLELLFFSQDRDMASDRLAQLSLQYVGF